MPKKLVLSLVFVLVACGPGVAPSVIPDAGDAGEVLDGSIDAGPDSGVDSGVDAGPADSGVDAGEDAGPQDAGVDAGIDAGPDYGFTYDAANGCFLPGGGGSLPGFAGYVDGGQNYCDDNVPGRHCCASETCENGYCRQLAPGAQCSDAWECDSYCGNVPNGQSMCSTECLPDGRTGESADAGPTLCCIKSGETCAGRPDGGNGCCSGRCTSDFSTCE